MPRSVTVKTWMTLPGVLDQHGDIDEVELEFEVDVVVASPSSPASWSDPGDGAELEVGEAYFTDSGWTFCPIGKLLADIEERAAELEREDDGDFDECAADDRRHGLD